MHSADDTSGPVDTESVIAAARQIFESAYYSFLTTLDEDGRPTSRLLQHFDPDPDLIIRVGTSAGSRKVAHVEADATVLVSCQNPAEHAYVSLTGTAVVIRDKAQTTKYWREPWRAIWPSGPEGGDYLVIEIRPERVDLTPGSYFAPSSPMIVVRTEDGWSLADGS